MKHILIITILAVCTSCALIPPETRVAGWKDWELCERLADYTFAGKTGWMWYTSTEVANRGLDKNAKCKAGYEARIKALARNQQGEIIMISFADALNTAFSEAATSE
jgi:hypothetical protein